jgi:metal-sulfur cluster biosynthetic enzyme
MPVSCCFHRGVFFDPEDEGDMFPRNIGSLSLVYTVYPEDGTVEIKLSMCSAACNEDV